MSDDEDAAIRAAIAAYHKRPMRPGEWVYGESRAIYRAGILAGMRCVTEIAIDISNTVHHESCNFGDDYKIGYAEGAWDVCHAARRAADSGSQFGDYLCEGGKWEGQSTPAEFWTHYEAVTGKKPNTKYGLPGIFSCSC